MNTIMRKLSFLAVLLTLLPNIGGAAAVDDEINRMEESRYAALIGQDWKSLDAILADDFFYNTAGGAQMSKSEFTGLMQSGAAVVRKVVRENSTVRSYGDVTLVTGMAHVDVTLKGEDKTLHSRYLHVWVKDGQGWKLAARQATYLPEKK
jgi:ketosteroid isomerase-like protein